MNWVGGSRNRYIKNKDETLRLKAFFQRQRMKKKTNHMDLTKEQNSGNMDMLSLFIVNQMASKKEKTDKPKINRFLGAKTTQKLLNEPLQFPMSSCPPSNLNLVTSQPKYSVGTPGFKTRKHHLHEGFKPLSPVFESNLSDASGSENQEQPSSSSAGFLDPIQTKPPPHLEPSKDNMKKHPWLASEWTDASNEVFMQDMTVAGLQPMREMSEHSAASVMFPVSNIKVGPLEEPQFIDFKNIDFEVLASLNSCNSSQKMENDSQFSMQEFTCTDSNTCSDASSVFVHVSESPRGVDLNSDEIEAQRHDGNRPKTLDTGTQTAALSYRDVSVQCSLIPHSSSVSIPAAHENFNVVTTRRQSLISNQCNTTTLSSEHKSTRNRPMGASATNQGAQRYPKLQTSLSFLKLRQMRKERELTTNLKQSLSRTEQRAEEGKQSENREVCDTRSESVKQNPVKDVRHGGESVKETKIRKV